MSYRAGDKITGMFTAVGRGNNAGTGVYVTIILDRMITANNFDITGVAANIYIEGKGYAEMDTETSISNKVIINNSIRFTLPIIGDGATAKLAVCELRSTTITFS